MRPDRVWMYSNRFKDGLPTSEFVKNIDKFIEFACAHPNCVDDGKIKCPCPLPKCQNKRFLDVEIVKVHISRKGFVPGYDHWICHGEGLFNVRGTHIEDVPIRISEPSSSDVNYRFYERMVNDVVGPQVDDVYTEELPNPEAQKFYDLMNSAKRKLCDGTNHTQLSATVKLLEMKCKHQASQSLVNDVCDIFQEVLPQDNLMPKDFYHAQKLVKGLGLPVDVIHCCVNSCMIYWGDDIELDSCRFCGHPRYIPCKEGSKRRKTTVPFMKMHYFPLIPRLQRLYASNATTSEMRWHAEHRMDEGKMCHPSDSAAWKHIDHTYQDFASEVRNVRLGLCTDGFQTFDHSGQQYSSWPVIVTPYNLPPGLAMKDEFFFLTILVPGPKNPKGNIDVFLQPLISELIKLWNEGVLTYDVSKKQNFQMRAILLWTISDFPAYSMLSGWKTSGRLACPCCMDDSDAFTLSLSGKQSWFDNHRKFLPENHPFRFETNSFKKGEQVRKIAPELKTGEDILAEINHLGLMKVTEIGAKEINALISKTCGWNKKSIFWDLPYWSKLLIRHNLDVMHIEKNVFDNLFNTILNVLGKTKDTKKSRDELNDICDRPQLAYDHRKRKYPKATYVLDRESRKILCVWVKGLRFPDGYASNLGRCVDLNRARMFGMKSHDCHVFLQRLLPIAFRNLLPPRVWAPITELCNFFKELTATTLLVEELERLENEIPIILCKLERIFPPSFFDSMEHLPVHLGYEARVAGPVQYRWMYPFERYLGRLKRKILNKNHVEGSISNGYLLEEVTKFTSYYFQDDDPAIPHKLKRNEVNINEVDDDLERITIFKPFGKAMGKGKKRLLSEKEYMAARSYVLLNCPEVRPFMGLYVDELRKRNPLILNEEIDLKFETEFVSWFQLYARPHNVSNPFLRSLAQGPLFYAKYFNGYYANGFKFHIKSYGDERATMNSGVCIKGSNYTAAENEYYGVLTDIIELEYPSLPIKKVVLFSCEWFDPTPKSGVVVHQQYKIIDIDHRKRFGKYEPFILAAQASQVYFCSYPSRGEERANWWAVCKIKARSTLDIPELTRNEPRLPPLQEDEMEEDGLQTMPIECDEFVELADENDENIILDDAEQSDEEYFEFSTSSEDDEVFFHAVGGNKKQRVHGLGACAALYFPNSFSRGKRSFSAHTDICNTVEFKRAVNQVKEEMEAEMEIQKAELLAHKAQMDAEMAVFKQQMIEMMMGRPGGSTSATSHANSDSN